MNILVVSSVENVLLILNKKTFKVCFTYKKFHHREKSDY